ncbi:hypothetical protein ACFPC0_10530 [Streptomyces andamanensis]|uniref:Uncharacterized protein n=1 Tax=Streptomyces andamanensis TaxID=1565035 RepID=A0ABV8TCC5_9ACTN
MERATAPGTEYTVRVERLESMCRTALTDLARLLRMEARALGGSAGDLEEAVQAAAAQAVQGAARRAAEVHGSAASPRQRCAKRDSTHGM